MRLNGVNEEEVLQFARLASSRLSRTLIEKLERMKISLQEHEQFLTSLSAFSGKSSMIDDFVVTRLLIQQIMIDLTDLDQSTSVPPVVASV